MLIALNPVVHKKTSKTSRWNKSGGPAGGKVAHNHQKSASNDMGATISATNKAHQLPRKRLLETTYSSSNLAVALNASKQPTQN